ncbi:MAG: DUF2911 domain-containing protein, partial [Gemmatimonadota bacterium]
MPQTDGGAVVPLLQDHCGRRHIAAPMETKRQGIDMKVRVLGAAIMVGMAAACGTVEDEPPVAETPIGEDAALAPDQDQVAVACAPMTGNMALDGRASPYDSVTVSIGGEEAKLCYGRPSMRDRDIYGGLVPYDTLWRTGANEPTTIHLPFPAEIAGLQV